MQLKEIYEKLLRAKRPIDFFDEVTDESELKRVYKDYAKRIHPDKVPLKDRYIANEAFSLLNRLYNLGIEELNKGIYSVIDSVKLYEQIEPLFELNIKGVDYKFYENLYEGEVAYIFKGTTDKDVVYLKVAIDSEDNDLLETEYNVLEKVRHQSLPYVEHKIMVNDTCAILMREIKGVTMPELMEQYKKGVPCEHVMWMLERLLSVVGFLHSNFVVHGNIKPENIIITKEVHNVSLVGFSFCIDKANTQDAKYKIVNDYYTAPEVNKTARVLPSSDIYSIGKIAIKLLGGDIVSNGMPISVDSRVRAFIRKMGSKDVSCRPNDAWELWSKLIKLRTEVFGNKRFKKID